MPNSNLVGETKKIISGPFEGCPITINAIQTKPRKRVIGNIELFGKIIPVDIPPEELGISLCDEKPITLNNIIEHVFNYIETSTEIGELFNTRASNEEINNLRDICRSNNIELPEVFYTFYSHNNGTNYHDTVHDVNSYSLFNNSTALLHINDIIETKTIWDMEAKKVKRDAYFDDEIQYLCWYWSNCFIPFEKTDYSLLAIDTEGIITGNRNQIISFGILDSPGAYIIYDSFEIYLHVLHEAMTQDLLKRCDKFSDQYCMINDKYKNVIQIKPWNIYK